MLALALAESPSLSVTVSVRRIRSPAIDAAASLVSGLLLVVCTTARCWSSVTVPLLALTLTVKTRSLPVAVRPSTTPPFITSTTAWPLRVSISPLSTAGLLTLRL